MEQPQPPQQQQTNEDNGNAKGGFGCRQSSTRWTPTTDQIRILKDLYYNNGIRSPSADHIQRITARLRQYGKIEGKNVFYWFQNHKARERQKKRFSNDHVTAAAVPMQQQQRTTTKTDDYSINNNKYYNISPGFSCASSSSAGVLAVGQMGTYYNNGYGSSTMERSFKDCSISAGANSAFGSCGWVGIDAYGSSYPLFDKRKSIINGSPLEEDDGEDQEEDATQDIETLPLFPMHHEGINGFCSIEHRPNFYSNNNSSWYGSSDHNDGGNNNGTSHTSLELSLNSYPASHSSNAN